MQAAIIIYPSLSVDGNHDEPVPWASASVILILVAAARWLGEETAYLVEGAVIMANLAISNASAFEVHAGHARRLLLVQSTNAGSMQNLPAHTCASMQFGLVHAARRSSSIGLHAAFMCG